MKSLTKILMLLTGLVAFSVNLAVAGVENTNFKKLHLPHGVELEVPRNWRIIGGDDNTNIETAGEAALNLSGVQIPPDKKVNLFRANSMPETTYAAIAINLSGADFTTQDIRSATAKDLEELTEMMRQVMQQVLARGGGSLIDFYPIQKREINSNYALVIRYKRSGREGPVFVSMTRLIVGKKEVSINLSYRESEQVLWRPIVEYIEKSYTVKR